MSAEIPPGILYLLHYSPQLLLPPLFIYLLNYVSSSQILPTYLSQWQTSVVSNLLPFTMLPFKTSSHLAIAMIASVPLTLGAEILWDDIKIRFEAWRLGAVLPPRNRDWWPAGIGFLLKQAKATKAGYLAEGLEEAYETLGSYTINNRVLYSNRIITSDPECIKIILATQFDHFEKGPETRWLFKPLLGTGVFAVDGELWRFHRSMTRPYFSRDRITHFDIFDRHSEHALNKLAERVREGVAVDVQDLVGRFTLDSATTFLFGHNVQSLSGRLPYPHNHPLRSQSNSPEFQNFSTRFAEAFSEAQLMTAVRSRYGVHWPLLEFWKDTMKEPMKVVKDLIEPIVEEAVRKKRQRAGVGVGKEEDGEGTLLENLVNETDDLEILRDAIMSLLVAGRDTTASTLTYAIYMLAEHPQVLKRLREEVLQKVGPSRRPEYDDLKDMKYLRATINETLRLYPAVPFNTRASNKATLWPSHKPGGKPYYIPANTRTPYSVFVMHRRKDLWGPDALEFDPDRFIDDRLHKYLIPHPFIFLPFNAGPRICLGQQFAYNETSFFLVRLLQKFDGFKVEVDAMSESARVPEEWKKDGKESRKKKEKIRPASHLTLHVKEGLWVTLSEASPHE
ncbi:cytochrome P450 [Agaricus bisporus var. bisporus H97]|uniref:cytochrome P450 n=1 Tax=Agaricus bisporus var. bisporus (strain H97 / ATCC MYA-4626 / FGSC 10389) TaxID=936046 RepID=UPI00029F4F9D|nr:cytochrome P450 [Agaricus bisporus var. bisporus H97]EKV48554.1 cytochrome P450 [Agaricus bisporus var. bisporus H97]